MRWCVEDRGVEGHRIGGCGVGGYRIGGSGVETRIAGDVVAGDIVLVYAMSMGVFVKEMVSGAAV